MKNRRPGFDHAARAPRADVPSGDVVYGLRAGVAAIEARPADVVAVACARETRREVDAAVRAAKLRVAPYDARPDELARTAGSPHHEGLVVTTRPRRWASPADLADLLVANKGACVALDRVRNPYNVGAILRSAAFFGVDAAILGAPAPHPALAPDAIRVAEGGAEHVTLSRTTDLADTLSRLKTRGVRVIGADGAAESSALGFAFARPAVLVVGNEREGMLPRVRALCDAIVAIPGTGAVESLNVGVATGVLLAELVRDRLTKTRRQS